MLYVDLNDRVLKRAKANRIGKYTKIGTQTVLWGGLGILIGSGVIGLNIIRDLVVLGCVNKATKWTVKNRKMIKNKIIRVKVSV